MTEQIYLLFDSLGWGSHSRFISRLLSHLPLIDHDLLPGAAILPPSSSSSGHPVILFSHGLYGFPSLYTFFCAELASHGFVVISIGHTDGSGYILSPLSGNVLHSYLPLPHHVKEQDIWAFRNKQLSLRVADMQNALKTAEELNGDPDCILYNALHLKKVALIGHSFGGITCVATLLAETENRISSVVSLDGWLFPLEGSLDLAFAERYAATALQRCPILFVLAEQWSTNEKEYSKNMERTLAFCRATHGKAQAIRIEQTGHHSWNDLPFWFPFISRYMSMVPTTNNLALVYKTSSQVSREWIELHSQDGTRDFDTSCWEKRPNITVLD